MSFMLDASGRELTSVERAKFIRDLTHKINNLTCSTAYNLVHLREKRLIHQDSFRNASKKKHTHVSTSNVSTGSRKMPRTENYIVQKLKFSKHSDSAVAPAQVPATESARKHKKSETNVLCTSARSTASVFNYEELKKKSCELEKLKLDELYKVDLNYLSELQNQPAVSIRTYNFQNVESAPSSPVRRDPVEEKDNVSECYGNEVSSDQNTDTKIFTPEVCTYSLQTVESELSSPVSRDIWLPMEEENISECCNQGFSPDQTSKTKIFTPVIRRHNLQTVQSVLSSPVSRDISLPMEKDNIPECCCNQPFSPDQKTKTTTPMNWDTSLPVEQIPECYDKGFISDKNTNTKVFSPRMFRGLSIPVKREESVSSEEDVFYDALQSLDDSEHQVNEILNSNTQDPLLSSTNALKSTRLMCHRKKGLRPRVAKSFCAHCAELIVGVAYINGSQQLCFDCADKHFEKASRDRLEKITAGHAAKHVSGDKLYHY